MAALSIEYGYSMDGIPELITRWLDAASDRYQYTLAEMCEVEPRTVGRWLKEESVPEGVYIDRLVEVLGLDEKTVKDAATVSRKRRKRHQPREEASPVRFIDERYVLTADDKRRWRELVQSDDMLSDDARTLLRAFTSYFAEENSLEVFIDKEQLAEEWSNLHIELIERVWPEIVESGYVLRRPFPGHGWVFWLQFPR